MKTPPQTTVATAGNTMPPRDIDALPAQHPRASRYVLVGFAIFQCFLGAGIVFGWTGILPMLEKERVYNELCEEGETFCDAQSVQLHFAFTVAASSNMCANLFLGLLFDRFGPRVAKTTSLLLLMLGAVVTGRSRYRGNDPGVDMFLPGMAMLGFGGTGVQLCSVHLSNLFPEAKSLVTCLIVGALQLSFVMFALFGYLYDRFAWPMTAIFDGYAVVLSLTLVATFYLSPDTPFQLPKARGRSSRNEEPHELLSPIRLPTMFNEDETSLLLSTPEMPKPRRSRQRQHARDLTTRSFKVQVRSPPFLLLSLLFSTGTLWCNYFVGSLEAQLRRKALSERDVGALMTWFGLVLPGSVVFLPLIGYLLDAWGHTRVTLLCCTTALLYTVGSWSQTYAVLVTSFVLYAFFRTTLFALAFAYLGHTFGFLHFGALSGLTFFIAAVVGLLQMALTQIGDLHVVAALQVTTLLLSFALPAYDVGLIGKNWHV